MIQIDKLMRAIFGEGDVELPPVEVVDEVLSTLRPKERFVLELRFGAPPMTLKAVGEIYPRADGGIGVVWQRIGQIECKALRRLRHSSRSRKLLKGRG